MISVRQEDIDNGKPFDSELCPIGLAVQRALKYIKLSKLSRNVLIQPIPFVATDFMRRFDKGEIVQPISFPINI